MVSASDRVTYQKKPMDRLTYERLKSLNLLVRSTRFGGEKSDITLLQGIGGAAASGGTHISGGCADVTEYNWKNREYGGRLLGGADWHRPYNWDNRKGGAHIHMCTCGVGYASLNAQRQVTAYWAGKNGLANNAKDAGPRLRTKPLFVAPYTARGARGVYYTKKGITLYTEGSTATKSLGTVPSGGKFTVIGVVNVGGTLWALNVDGKHAKMTDLSISKPPTTPPTPKKVTLNVGTVNVIRWRLGQSNPRGASPFQKGPNYYPDRVKEFAKMQDKMGVSILTTVESGQYIDADRITAALGVKDWVNTLHGDDAGDITEAIHVHKKRKVLEEGRIITGPAVEVGYHNTATWNLLEDTTGSGVIHLEVVHHAEWRERGTTSASAADKRREKHTKGLIVAAEKLAKAAATKYHKINVPIVFSGDFNQDKDDFYDGPGKAMAAAGYVDAETLCTGKTGPETTINSYDPDKVTGRRLDRFFVKKGTPVGVLRTIPGYPWTDHNAVAVELTLTNG